MIYSCFLLVIETNGTNDTTLTTSTTTTSPTTTIATEAESLIQEERSNGGEEKNTEVPLEDTTTEFFQRPRPFVLGTPKSTKPPIIPLEFHILKGNPNNPDHPIPIRISFNQPEPSSPGFNPLRRSGILKEELTTPADPEDETTSPLDNEKEEDIVSTTTQAPETTPVTTTVTSSGERKFLVELPDPVVGDEIIVEETPSPQPVFIPEKHLERELDTVMTPDLTTIVPSAAISGISESQFLYNSDFAAYLNRFYYSSPVFDNIHLPIKVRSFSEE